MVPVAVTVVFVVLVSTGVKMVVTTCACATCPKTSATAPTVNALPKPKSLNFISQVLFPLRDALGGLMPSGYALSILSTRIG